MIEQTTHDNGPAENTTSASYSLMDSLPEDLRHDPSLADFKDVPSLAKSYVHAKKMLGSSVKIPGEGSTKEDYDRFYEKAQSMPGLIKLGSEQELLSSPKFKNAMGIPETSDQYKYTIEGDIDADFVKNFSDEAHKIGLSNTQAQRLLDLELQSKKDLESELKKKKERTEEILKERWGDKYEDRSKVAQSVINSLKERYPEEVEGLIAGGTLDSPVLMSLLADVGSSIHEPGNTTGSTTKTEMSVAVAEAKFQELKTDKDFMASYLYESHPGHRDAVAQMNKLLDVIHGNQG